MRPLDGVRVLSLEQFGAGPYGTSFLADLGAEVIKIENPETGGDPARYTGPHLLGEADSEYFQTWNSGKRSLALDLKSRAGREAFLALVPGADAVVNNLRGDQPAKLGIDYRSLKALNPALVCLHISAYGRDNERKSWPGYDYLMQAEAGLMSITGEPAAPPARFGPSIVDYMTGLTGIVGLLAALLRARATGVGCDVDTCLFEVGLHQLGYTATWYLNHGDAAERQPRSAHFSVAPVQTFPTADGWIFVMCMTEKFWTALTDALGRPDLRADARFATNAARAANRGALSEALDAEFRKETTEAWLARLSGLLPVGPVYDLKDALDNPFVERIGMVREVAHPENAALKLLASPLKIDGERLGSRVSSALGADNAALLATPRRTRAGD
ncbi:MAG TPA: CoA transferase [Alphaproteobacteria bacterium]|nr:CoA transferase [Alphaproteobacteria bacterium]